MNHVAVRSTLIRNSHGLAAVEQVLALALVASVGALSLSQFGHASEHAIASETTPAATSSALVTSQQAGAFEVVSESGKVLQVLERSAAEANAAKGTGLLSKLPKLTSGDLDSELSTAARTFHILDRESGIRVHLNMPEGPTPRGGFPVAVHYGGLAGDARFYVTTPEMMVGAGIATAMVDIPTALEMSFATRVRNGKRALDAVEAFANWQRRGGRINMEKLSVVGHSFGGATSVALGYFDPRVKRVVAESPGFPPSDILAQIRRGKMPNRNALMDKALAQPEHAEMLYIGAEYDMVVPPKRYALPLASSCTDGGVHCRYVNLPNAGHANFVDVPFSRIPVWAPTFRNPGRIKYIDITALSPRARTGASQRRAAGQLVVDFLTRPWAK